MINVLELILKRKNAEHWQYVPAKIPLNRKPPRNLSLALRGAILENIRCAFWLSARRGYRVIGRGNL